MYRNLWRFIQNRRGSIAISTTITFTVLVGFTALGVDVANMFADRRKAQSTADLAAIAAVSDLSNASKAAGTTVASNGYLNNAAFNVEYGIYTPDRATAPNDRFKSADVSSANAARITLTTVKPLFFSSLITGKDSYVIKTTATATRSAFASFAIGSRLASVDGGVLNQMLGGMLGTSLSLSAMDYQSLLATQLDLFGFMDALAARLNLTAGSYSSVLSSDASMTDVIGAMVDAGKKQYGATNSAVQALSGIASLVAGLSGTVKVGSLVDLGPYDSLPVGNTPKVTTSVAVYDLVSAAAQLANGRHSVQAALALNVPGIASANVKFAIGERPQGTSWVTVGSEGASVHTAQTRLLLTVQVAGSGAASLINLPIYIEVASATATLNKLQCGFPNVSTSTATVNVTPGVLDAWIGAVPDSQFNNFTTAPNPPAADLVNTSLVKITGRAHASITNMSATPVTFSYSDIQQKTKKTVGTTDFSSTLLRGLIRDTQIDVNILGLGLGLGGLSSLVSTTLSYATPAIDQVLNSALQTLGIGLGQADVWMLGIRCDGAVLVL
ncbi:MAG TPA: pilus assembly protein TadG-related protein [Pseudolabrys sp.]|nr:pilus assembly protein TadG-related protein [Pseudolabrys sp.]